MHSQDVLVSVLVDIAVVELAELVAQRHLDHVLGAQDAHHFRPFDHNQPVQPANVGTARAVSGTRTSGWAEGTGSARTSSRT